MFSNSPKCFWVEQITTFALLNVKGREFWLFDFFEKYTSCACFLGSGLNCIFHWKPQLLITCKSLFYSLCDLYLSKTCEKRDVPSAKILQVDWMLSGKSLMYIRNKRGPRTERTLWHSRFQKLPKRDLTIKNYSLIALMKIISKKIEKFSFYTVRF